MPYGTIKVDTITFTSSGVDTSIAISGLVRNPSITGDLTVTGTISGNTITGAAGNFTDIQTSNSISGTNITGNAAGFTTVTGTTITGTTVNAQSGVFTTRISGLTITGGTAGFTTVTGTTVTGTTANFVAVSGTTVTGGIINSPSGVFPARISGTAITGDTAGFTAVTGTTLTGTTLNATSGVFTTQVSGNLYRASGNVTVISGSGDVRPYGLYSFPTTTGVSGYVLTTNSDGSSTWQAKVRAVSASATSGTLTPDSRTTDLFVASGLTGAITMAIPAGTPHNGQRLLIRFKDNGTARAITWTTSASGYRAIGITLPTTTTSGKTSYVGCVYNSADTYWDAVATVTEA